MRTWARAFSRTTSLRYGGAARSDTVVVSVLSAMGAHRSDPTLSAAGLSCLVLLGSEREGRHAVRAHRDETARAVDEGRRLAAETIEEVEMDAEAAELEHNDLLLLIVGQITEILIKLDDCYGQLNKNMVKKLAGLIY